MPGELLLGVDIGTQGAKAVLCDLDGHVLSSSYREHSTSAPRPGWAEHDADRLWWGAFVELQKETLARASADPRRLAGIGVSAFVPGLLALDSRGRPVRPAILYTDRRAETELSILRTRIQSSGLSESEIGPIDLASPLVQWLWLVEHEPSTVSRTARIVQCAPYIVLRLTGVNAIDHAMKRSYAPLYDPLLDGWSGDRAAVLDLDVNVLPDRIAWADQVAGHVTSDAAAETGLCPGTPVAVGTADAFAEMVGAGVVEPGSAAILYGSFTALLVATTEPESAWHGYHCLPDLYFSGAGVHTGAALTRWFRDQLGGTEVAIESATGRNVYELFDEQASLVPAGCDGLIALPDFSGARSRLDPHLARGALLGLTLNHSRAHMYRALLEGVAYELRYQMISSGGTAERLMAVGGGSRSTLWTQITSDVLGVAQDVLDVPSAAPFGAAYLAGMAAGVLPDTQTLKQRWLRVKRTVQPDPRREAPYAAGYHAYVVARNAIA